VSTDNLVLEHLREIRATLDRHTDDLLEIKGRLGLLEQQYASISRRVDSIDARLDRVEKRLDLVEA
jgi:predicted  nucleic acid-binding Zn-ribbon protein